MKTIIIICIVLFGLHHFKEQAKRDKLTRETAETPTSTEYNPSKAVELQRASNNSGFKCDGRVYCSQMQSCDEATFFINNCPGTKMDGDNDGIPCEKQFC